MVVLVQTGRGWWVVSIERLEGQSGVRFKYWKGAEVLFQMTNMLVVAFLFGGLLMMLLRRIRR